MRRKTKLRAIKTGLFSGALMAGQWANAQTIAYDINAPGKISNANGALIFTATGSSSTGTGSFGGFLTVNSNNPQTSGISTDGTVGPDVTAAQTSTQTMSQLPTTVINSVTYRSFAIDLRRRKIFSVNLAALKPRAGFGYPC